MRSFSVDGSPKSTFHGAFGGLKVQNVVVGYDDLGNGLTVTGNDSDGVRIRRRLAEFEIVRTATVTNIDSVRYTCDLAGNVQLVAHTPTDNDGAIRPGASDAPVPRSHASRDRLSG